MSFLTKVSKLFGFGKKSSKNSSTRKAPTTPPAPKSSAQLLTNSIERKAREKRRATLNARKAQNAQNARNKEPRNKLGRFTARRKNAEPFHMPTTPFNENLGSLRKLKSRNRTPATVVKYQQAFNVMNKIRANT